MSLKYVTRSCTMGLVYISDTLMVCGILFDAITLLRHFVTGGHL